ncbi:MAG: hypothetical protein M1814_003945 [Vezdaea aestivalis]|nr:MAG: hypothetical protein M1814_003945 [Vezdaea aestivalis]
MSPRIHCVRHAEGLHSLNTPHNHHLRDPSLTAKGEQQCHVLQKKFPAKYDIGLIVCSPLRRTVYTSLLGFDNIVKHGVHVIAHPDLQEISDLPCDSGSPIALLQEEFAGLSVDLSLVTPGWESKQGPYEPTPEAIRARAAEARTWLKAQKESDIVVVTHGGFLHYLTEDWTRANEHVGTGWANTEFRSYTFDEATQNSLIELKESRDRRQVIPATAAEQIQLFQTTNENWVKEGLMGQKVEA